LVYKHNKIININLTTKKINVEEIPMDYYKEFFGGSGLAIKLFLERFNINKDPLDEDMPMIFAAGLLTGSGLPTSCKFSVCGKSPLTGIWNESTGGGYWGSKFKFTGHDVIIITGKSKSPVYIWINNDQIEIRDAKCLWGLDTYKTAELIKGETNKTAEIASIGMAGEKLSRMASINVGGQEARAIGRGGMGALMGSKNLKAVAVYGNKKPVIGNKEYYDSFIKKDFARIKNATEGFGQYGTASNIKGTEARGDLPIKNWQLGTWDDKCMEQVTNETLIEKYFSKHYHCFSCPIHCGKEFKIKEGKYAGTVTSAPEYETNAGFGSNLLNSDGESIIMANNLCNMHGLDTISTSMAVAFAMEAYERKIIGPDDTDGLDLTWGNSDAVVELVKRIIKREGIGDILADGTVKAAERLGNNSEEFVVCAKGLEFPMHDPRSSHAMGLNYATGNRGACHLDALTYYTYSGFTSEELDFGEKILKKYDPMATKYSARLTYGMQNYLATFNALGICKFLFKLLSEPSQITKWVNAVMDWELDYKQLLTAGERMFHAKRMFNVELGISRKDDTLPGRILSHKTGTGHAADSLPNLGRLLSDYYSLRDWDEFGIPKEEKLEELGLSNLRWKKY